jgi:hypothetical protein
MLHGGMLLDMGAKAFKFVTVLGISGPAALIVFRLEERSSGPTHYAHHHFGKLARERL